MMNKNSNVPMAPSGESNNFSFQSTVTLKDADHLPVVAMSEQVEVI